MMSPLWRHGNIFKKDVIFAMTSQVVKILYIDLFFDTES